MDRADTIVIPGWRPAPALLDSRELQEKLWWRWENDAVAALLSLLSKRDRGWCISSPVRDEQRNQTGTNGLFRGSISNLIEVMADERWKRLAEQQGVAYAKTVAEAMNLKLDADNPANREKLRRAVLDLVAER